MVGVGLGERPGLGLTSDGELVGVAVLDESQVREVDANMPNKYKGRIICFCGLN